MREISSSALARALHHPSLAALGSPAAAAAAAAAATEVAGVFFPPLCPPLSHVWTSAAHACSVSAAFH